MAELLLDAERLTRHFGPLCAVDDVSFRLHRGEVLGFLGPNGAGKSTTMRMLTGNLAPDSGRIAIGGVDLFEQPRRARAELGYLPEQPPLYNDLSVDEYLTFCARLHGIPRARRAAALAHVVDQCGLGDCRRRLIGNLSKGYRQRLGIAQAILHRPAVVVLDEPTSGLDPLQIREIRGLIRRLGGDYSVILSTHILSEVQSVCDRVQILRKGRLILDDTIAGLERRMELGRLRVAFAEPPPASLLIELPGVEAVESLEDGGYLLDHRLDIEVAETVAQQAAANGWRLRELTPQRRSIEELFVELLQDEPDSPEASQ